MFYHFLSVFVITEQLLQNRPLPEIPDHSSPSSSGVVHSVADDSPISSSGFVTAEGSAQTAPPQRWMSKENLLSQTDEPLDPQLFVALYEFHSGGENQLSLRKGIEFQIKTVFFFRPTSHSRQSIP